jgi:hypothetical protein
MIFPVSPADCKSVMPRDERGRWVRLPRTPASTFGHELGENGLDNWIFGKSQALHFWPNVHGIFRQTQVGLQISAVPLCGARNVMPWHLPMGKRSRRPRVLGSASYPTGPNIATDQATNLPKRRYVLILWESLPTAASCRGRLGSPNAQHLYRWRFSRYESR